MKQRISAVINYIKGSKKYILRLFSSIFLGSLLIASVLVVKFPTFFLQKAAPGDQDNSDAAIATLNADQLSVYVQDDTIAVLNFNKSEKLDDGSFVVTKSSILKERQDKSVTRRKYMKVLLQKDTEKFLRLAVPDKVISNLDPKIKDNFEKEVSLEGDIENIEFENLNTKRVEREVYLNSREGRLRLFAANKNFENIKTGTKVKVNGFMIDNELATAKVDQPAVREDVLAAATDTFISTSTRTNKLAVVLFEFQDKRGIPWTLDEIKKWLFTDSASLNGYYKEVSFGQVTFTGDVFGPVQVPINAGSECGAYYEGSIKAKEILTSQGVNFDSYDFIAYDFPFLNNCWASAWAEVGGKNSWFNSSLLIYDSVLPTPTPSSSRSSPAPYILPITRAGIAIHEIGHNLGMWHANSYSCKDSSGTLVSIGSFANCRSNEYGDPFDVMGFQYSNPRHLSNYHKGLMGWLPSFETKTTGKAGDYDLYAIERNFVGTNFSPVRVQSFRIPAGKNPNNGMQLYYYLEYRKKLTGIFDQFNSNDPVVNGVSVRLAHGYNLSNSSWLLDISPSDQSFLNSVIAPGKVFDDSMRGIKIAVGTPATNANRIPFTLRRSAPPCIRNQPIVQLYPIAGWGKPGETLYYSIGITNTDSLGCGTSTFTIVPTLFSGWTQSPSPAPAIVSPEQTVYVGLQVTSASHNPTGYFTFSEKVVHPAGEAYSVSILANYNVYYSDSTPPTINIISPVEGQIVSGQSMQIQADINDNTQVSFADAWVDDENQACGWNVGPFTCYFEISGLAPGTHTLTINAFDVLYNFSKKSVGFNVTALPLPTGIVITPSPTSSPSAPPTEKPTSNPSTTPTISPSPKST